MFEKLTFSSDEDKINFDKYIAIRGKYVFQQVYKFVCNITNDECTYLYLSSCIRYDKTLRDTLYKYLATFEEYLRAQIFNKYEITRETLEAYNDLNDMQIGNKLIIAQSEN